ncbi:hypothetical protein [Oceanicella sp. SM1341]|uniref:hypothetical protein n=1 Tax=Oceanicella sp. SM1341 TaxID=1548889 RepID=UPI000E51A7B6|nr:hypothetical protein [Oceanicella sp. SM1341]
MATSNVFNIGNDVVLPGSGYPSLAAFTIPVTAGLVGAFFLGDGLAMATKNWAAGGADASVVGAPVEVAGGLQMDSANHLELPIPESLNATVVLCARVPQANGAALFGNSTGAANPGLAVYAGAAASNASFVVGKAGNTRTFAPLTGNDIANGSTLAIRVPATGACKTYDYEAGLSEVAGNADARELNGLGNYRLGAIPGAGFNEPGFVNSLFVFNQAKSDTQIAALMKHLHDYAVSVGFAVAA